MKPLPAHQVALAGQFWDRCSAAQCRFLMCLGDGYWDERQEALLLLKWKDLGEEIQGRIAKGLFVFKDELIEFFRKQRR